MSELTERNLQFVAGALLAAYEHLDRPVEPDDLPDGLYAVRVDRAVEALDRLVDRGEARRVPSGYVPASVPEVSEDV